jgi:hypothetical protein
MQETNRDTTKSSLSQPRAQLIELMQHINFGRIEGIIIRNGEFVLDPRPRVVREIKFCAENGPRPEATKQDFVLKAQVRDFFAQVEALGNGFIHSLEVKHGLPFKMIVEENTA